MLELELGGGTVGELISPRSGRPSGPAGMLLTMGGGRFALYDGSLVGGAAFVNLMISPAVANRWMPGLGGSIPYVFVETEPGAVSARSRAG
jgi:hypothetical protein